MTAPPLFHSDPMPIELQLSEAFGALHSPTGAPTCLGEDPLLTGRVHFDVTSRWRASLLPMPVEAWLDMQGGKLRYRLSVGGIPGWMGFRRRIAGAGPDYSGALGPNGELQVAAWRNRLQAGECFSLTLLLYSSSLGTQGLERLLARSLGMRG